MKKLIYILLTLSLLLTACSTAQTGENTQEPQTACETHVDDDANSVCDVCKKSVLTYVDFYSINDLHGKVADGDSQPGVDELTTYLAAMKATDEYAFFLSAGDMWQGSAESNMTKGKLTTEWMNKVGFTAMAPGNHDYDWGETYIKENEELAEFPFLAINIYNRQTNEPVEYCQPSVMVEAGNIQVGIIGAMGDCYNSISAEQTKDIYFKVGDELTELVKKESERLRNEGADVIVYVTHEGYGESANGVKEVSTKEMSDFYDVELSNGYVDLVFEGHTHQGYVIKDEYGVYHLQNRGDNSGGISHVELGVNSVTGDIKVNLAQLVPHDQYTTYPADPVIEDLKEVYKDELAYAYEVLGQNDYERKSNYLSKLVIDLYLEAALEKWGEEYDIVLAGGDINVRKPYNLKAGDVRYADLQALFPFDNEVALCEISGADLQKRFIRNSDYEIAYSEYGNSIRNNIDPNATYYIVADYGHHSTSRTRRQRLPDSAQTFSLVTCWQSTSKKAD